MEAIHEARELAANLGIEPFYIVSPASEYLTDAEREFMFMNEGILAFTNPIADLLSKNGALRYEWEGRGCCVVFRTSPMQLSLSQVCGLVIHEIGHFVDAADRPEREDQDHGRAVKAAWRSMQTSEAQHGPRWFRATVHLWHRACRMGYGIPLVDVRCMEQYGYGRADLAPVLEEASVREGEPIEQIICGPGPRSIEGRRRPKARIKAAMIGGQAVRQHPDGSIETLPDLFGVGGGHRYKSVREFLNALDKQSQLVG